MLEKVFYTHIPRHNSPQNGDHFDFVATQYHSHPIFPRQEPFYNVDQDYWKQIRIEYSWSSHNFGLKTKQNIINSLVQVNLCQKHSFSNQLTHNITTDCSLIPDFSTRKIQLQNMLCTNIVFCLCFGLQNNVCTQHVLNLYFSCTEFRNECTICRHIVG